MQKSSEDDRLDDIFHALANRTRRALLGSLASGPARVTELAEPHGMSVNAISKHLFVLEEAGLISRSRRATSRISHLEAQPLREATAWLAEYQRFWDERYDQLDELLSKLQRPERKDSDHEQDTDQRTGGRPVRRHHPRVRRSP